MDLNEKNANVDALICIDRLRFKDKDKINYERYAIHECQIHLVLVEHYIDVV